MTDPITVREWTDVVRRARLGRTVKAVALVLATYADFGTGTRVHPGVARLAIDAEVSYNIAKQALGRLRQIGLIELVRRSRRRGEADDYRLILGAELLDHVDVLSPAQLAGAVVRMRDAKRRGGGSTDPDGPSGGTPVQPTARAVQPVDNPDVQPTPWAVDEEVTDRCTAHGSTPTGGCTAHGVNKVRPTPCPPISHTPTTTPTPHTLAEVDRNHPAAGPDAEIRDSQMVEQSEDQAPPLPDRCAHGFPARYRPDGTLSCALCRRAVPATTADPDPPATHTSRPALRIVPA